MSRLNVDTIVSGASVARARSVPGALDLVRTEGSRFDEHLRRAAGEDRAAAPQAPSDSDGPDKTKAAAQSGPAAHDPKPPKPRREEKQPAEQTDSRPAESGGAKSESDANPTSTSDEPADTETEAAESSAAEEEKDEESTAEDRGDNPDPTAEGDAIAIVKDLATEDLPKTSDSQPTEGTSQTPVLEDIAASSWRGAAVDREQAAARPANQQPTGPETATPAPIEPAALAASSDPEKKDADGTSRELRVRTKPVADATTTSETPPSDPALSETTADVVEPSAAPAGDHAVRTKESRRSAAAQRVEASKAAPPQQDASADAAPPTAPPAGEALVEKAASAGSTTLETTSRDTAAAAPAPSGREAVGQVRGSSGETVRPAATAPTGADDGTAQGVDRVRFVERVARAFGSSSREGGVVRMRLHPPELGLMRIEIAMRDGAMTARLETDTAEARNLLLDNLPALRDRLNQQEIKIERFEVTYNQSGLGGGSPEGPDDRRSGRGESGRRGDAATEPVESSEPVSRRGVTLPGQGATLDVFV
ncbi:MAG: flagellar hook-length control protein FliK [Pirellulales bacterium]|nr:flagellar hook-length control protein FliK [Pirellulales bacterium]